MNAISEKLQRSWQLFQRSVEVIRDHPKLLVFPIVTGLLTTAIALFFLAPVALMLLAPHWGGNGNLQVGATAVGFVQNHHGNGTSFHMTPAGSLILAGVYLVNMFVATMASVAFNHEILEALSGRQVSIQRGIAAACSRWKSVLLWSLLAGVVGLMIRALEQRLAFVGRIVAGFIGLAWSVASIFAIPILARDPSVSSPFEVLSKSGGTIKRTWGEALAGYVGMQGMNILVVGGSILFWVAAGAGAILTSNPWILLMAGLPWLAGVIAYGYLSGIASRVYLCALYLYASEGFVPNGYDSAMMNAGWKHKTA